MYHYADATAGMSSFLALQVIALSLSLWEEGGGGVVNVHMKVT